MIKRDRVGRFKFAPLQGVTAARLLSSELKPSELHSIIFYDRGQVSRSSTAVIHIVADLGGVWSLARIFLIVPVIVSDAVYAYIAQHRYTWFGKRESCRLPTPEERAQFLD